MYRTLTLPLAMFVLSAGAYDWYVSTNGSGNGSIGSPWFLQTALTNVSVNPGDTIWLRGGTYFPTATFTNWDVNVQGWQPTINGASSNLITLRSYPGEWAAIDREWDLKNGPSSYLRFRDLEFYDSLKGHNLTNSQYPNGPWVHFAGPPLATAGFEWINCLFHDMDNCFGGGAAGNCVRGCIFWYVGWNQLEHVFYGPPTTAYGNISAWHWNAFIEHSYPEVMVQSNIVFGSGAQSSAAGGLDMLFDGGGTAINNYFWNYDTYTNQFTFPQVFASVNGNTIINSNVIVGSWAHIYYDKLGSNFFTSQFLGNTVYQNNPNHNYAVVDWHNYGTSTFNSNSYFSKSNVLFQSTLTFAQWKTNGFDLNSTSSDSTSPPDAVYVVPNQDQSKRAHIAVFNFTLADTVSVNLVGILNQGDTYRLYSAQNYNTGPIQSDTFGGSTISVPMTNLTTAPILFGTNINYSQQVPSQPPLTSPQFGAFVLIGSAASYATATTLHAGTLRSP